MRLHKLKEEVTRLIGSVHVEWDGTEALRVDVVHDDLFRGRSGRECERVHHDEQHACGSGSHHSLDGIGGSDGWGLRPLTAPARARISDTSLAVL